MLHAMLIKNNVNKKKKSTKWAVLYASCLKKGQ